MRVVEVAVEGVVVEVSQSELLIINNVLNEVCKGSTVLSLRAGSNLIKHTCWESWSRLAIY